MLITISTPNLSTEYKQLIEATFEQSTSTYVVFVGDGVYAPALNTAFFEQLANTVESTVKDKSTLNLSFLSTDADTRGANLPEHINPISHKELAAISAKNQHWIPLS
ncbi:MAG: hypothetical protein Altm2KO_00160 [Alteromonas macleodii]|jgi:hypothetical protein|uniref:DsrE/DsrF-like family protein n=1 Tax=Alteromonas macleodii TaxID=28108 RepID=A0AB36FUW7_ALTMA|nr:hypothetical protein [Alteromonas macleodii]MCG8496333.1 DsrH/TusB family sulfur relay protein [Enterobacterales bacterium]MDM7962142.1 hypothetical protein [Alteromonas macleodii]MDM8170574.1 hypothetical protein [Alteromonas macleodii]OES32008.1 hypothetical protein BFV95_2197 [Alteromonas macleodii]OES32145.1 hypothetical protein BFV94_2195 [Alteromonas macleodii]